MKGKSKAVFLAWVLAKFYHVSVNASFSVIPDSLLKKYCNTNAALEVLRLASGPQVKNTRALVLLTVHLLSVVIIYNNVLRLSNGPV